MNGGRVAIVGGGLAGLATAVAMVERGFEVDLFESRRALGGRAGSFLDAVTGECVDHCQHVSLGCCTYFADFCRRTLTAGLMRRECVLHFFAPDGTRYDVAGCRWLPAPLHLLPSLLRLGFLCWSDRLAIVRLLWRLSRTADAALDGERTIGQWLRAGGASARAIERFWSAVIVSALGESVERASLSAARKVFVEGFMASPRAYEMLTPLVPLGELYGQIERWLTERKVRVQLGRHVATLDGDQHRIRGLTFADNTSAAFDFVVVAVPWRRLAALCPPPVADALPWMSDLASIESAPITAVHLWFDRPIVSLPHAVLVGKLSQWIFTHGPQPLPSATVDVGYRCQIVISASRPLEYRDRDEVIDDVRAELASVFPAARQATMLHYRMVTQRDAVFSSAPGVDRRRPIQKTAIANLFLAGDWTATQWPATMESAVRSGYLAASALLASTGASAPDLQIGELPRGRFARWLLK